VLGAFGLTRLIASQLFGVRPTDPTTFILVALTLVGVAILATLVPALRATRVDPVVALRDE
jgi:putative ABC transport system permease protein